MNTRQLQYAVLLSKVRNFSQVAGELSISQPALSKQIIALENELGVKLFDRSTTPLTLTQAGESFVQMAERLLFEEDLIIKTMNQYKTGEKGRLVIGVSPFRSQYLMPRIVRGLTDKFPHLKVILMEASSAQLHKGIEDGLYDFAIMNLPVDESRFEVHPLEKDELVLAVPREMLSLLDRENCAPSSDLDLSECVRLPFVTLSQGQELRQLFDKLCTASSVQLNIQVEVVGIATAWAMVQHGIAASLLPKQFVQYAGKHDVTLFPLKQKAFVRQPAVVTRRGQFISKYAAYAIKFIQNDSVNKAK